ncbi:MAG: hypothetical protein NC114_06745 [Ruminococcus flavefaciens]|nr:hypothetical protein [Ruminococcus flavefaciens]
MEETSMIVKFDVKLSAYDLVKFAVPAVIIASVPMPSVVTTGEYRTIMNRDNPAIENACRNFIKSIPECRIRDFIMNLHEADPMYEDYEFPYTYEILSLFSAKDIGDPCGDIIHMALSPTHSQLMSRLHADDVVPYEVAASLADSTCMCCQLNEDIYSFLSEFQSEHAINCPRCGSTIDTTMLEATPVQAANFYDPAHRVGIYPTCTCPNKDCGAVVALIPTEIEWNANHDVYYTGGASYMAGSYQPGSAAAEIQEIFEKKLWPDIKQFVERKLHPKDYMDEGLTTDFNLKLWTERDFSAAMCEYWYKHGLKE